MNIHTNKVRLARQQRVRRKVKKFSLRPRLVVTRTHQHIYAQIVDSAGKVLAHASDIKLTVKGKSTKTAKAAAVGEALGKKAKAAKVIKVALDRGNYKYHGRVKALADAARSQGMEF